MGLKKLIDLDLLDRFLGKVKELIPSTYADSAVAGGAASKTEAIPFGIVDNTSTSTIFTATVPGITELKDGTAVLLKNGVVTSKAGFTININNLGAYPAYSNMAAATAESTVFNIDYTMLFVFDSTRGENGGWICYRGYDSNTNTIGYYIRTNSSSRPMDSITYRYRILFSSADDTKWVPSTNSTSTNATAARDVCQTPINPFGEIVYYGTTASVAAGSSPSTSYLWQQNVLTFGYAFNRTGAALVLTYPAPIYIKCAPQSDGSAVIDANTPYVQQLPSTADGKIYIYLGRAYSATSIELVPYHPVYYYSDGAIRLWTNQNGSGGSAESFIVNVTQDPNTEEYQADKTYTEIRSAIDNGLTVFARLNLSFTSVWYALLEDSSYGITFYLISVTDAWGGKDLYCERLTVSTENEWSMDSDNVTIIGESMEAESGGTDLSLVTTDEKYVWNSKYDASNPPPYPVTSVNGSTGAVTIPTLPSVSSSDNDKVLKVVSGAWAAATGDSGKVMVVNITFDSDSSEYSADKTFSEISTATNDGYVIVAKY